MKVRTPQNVLRNWYNFSDLEDKVAIDYSLSGDYEENSKHIKVIDKVVYNNYEYNGHRNTHKSYGYLRTPELAEVINDFLIRDKRILVTWYGTKEWFANSHNWCIIAATSGHECADQLQPRVLRW